MGHFTPTKAALPTFTWALLPTTKTTMMTTTIIVPNPPTTPILPATITTTDSCKEC